MNSMKFIARENINLLLEGICQDSEVWAPRELPGSGGTVLFERWRSGDPVDFDHISSISAKDMVLPRTERLFGFNYTFGGGFEQVQIEPGGGGQAGQGDPATGGEQARGALLFGARACDARALTTLDALFVPSGDDDYNDPAYRERRAGLTVVTLACASCDAACFCSSFENGTAEKAGSDIILYEVDGGFLAETVTEKGGAITASALFEASSLKPPVLAETARVEGLERLEKLLPAIFDDLDFWQDMTAACISCGFCTHGCPTCHCFNIHDEMRGDRAGERLRSWDACMFYLYTQETSGHNPRPTPAHRYRNRTNHKFSYYPENRGEILCTGCGRCIRGCPVGIDIRDVLQKALKRAGSAGSAGSSANHAPGEST